MQGHEPVMLDEALEYLDLRPSAVCVDCTTGLGGHAREIARRLTGGCLVALDRDPESLEIAARNLARVSSRVVIARSRFSELRETLRRIGIVKADALLADLGASRYQLTNPERGFSFTQDAPLDMRMDRSSAAPTAADVLNFSSEQQIADILYRLGEERRGRKLARAIVRARPIRTTLGLARVIEATVSRTARIHPATQTFMALRMYVNHELEELEALLDAAPDVVSAGGRVVLISFHSGEDRIAKRAFRQWAREGRAILLTKHVVKPNREEVRRNAASRSAKLRAAQMC